MSKCIISSGENMTGDCLRTVPKQLDRNAIASVQICGTSPFVGSLELKEAQVLTVFFATHLCMKWNGQWLSPDEQMEGGGCNLRSTRSPLIPRTCLQFPRVLPPCCFLFQKDSARHVQSCDSTFLSCTRT